MAQPAGSLPRSRANRVSERFSGGFCRAFAPGFLCVDKNPPVAAEWYSAECGEKSRMVMARVIPLAAARGFVGAGPRASATGLFVVGGGVPFDKKPPAGAGGTPGKRSAPRYHEIRLIPETASKWASRETMATAMCLAMEIGRAHV